MTISTTDSGARNKIQHWMKWMKSLLLCSLYVNKELETDMHVYTFMYISK